MSDSDDSDSILPNLQKTRELWSQKSVGDSADFLIPKSPISPVKQTMSLSPTMENHVNGTSAEEYIVRSDDKTDDDFEMPDVRSMKSQWEKAGPVPTPKKSTPRTVERKREVENHATPELVPVNRDQEENKEEYDVHLGKLREKFEKEAKEASSSKVVWNDGPKKSVSKASVDEKKNLNKKHASSTQNKVSSTKSTYDKRFESEIEAQRHYISNKDGPAEMPTVELSSIKMQFEQRKDEKLVTPMTKSTSNSRKSRQISISSESSSTTAEVVRYDDPPVEQPKYEVEISSLRMKFEQAAAAQKAPPSRSRPSLQKKVSDSSVQQQRPRPVSESDNVVEVVRSSDARYDEMIGEESVKDRLARYKAMTEAAKPQATSKHSYKRRSTTDLVIKKKVEEVEEVPIATVTEEQEIVRSPPAGTKEKPDYKASIDLDQARQLFEQKSTSPTRSSRSSSRSPSRRSPRSQSTPSPLHRGSRSSSASGSKSPSPARQSVSSQSSGRKSPGTKKFGDPDIVVLEHSEVNYYYDNDGTRLSTKTKGLDDLDQSAENMSNADVIRPSVAGTKEEADYVPSVNMHSVRDMFENPKAEDFSRGRAPPKKTIVIEKRDEDESEANSPERNPDIVRSTAAGTREEPQFEVSIDLKAARSKFESPQRAESYVPRNRIREREEEVRRQRAAVAAASPRSSESSDSGYEVVKTAEAGSKEKPEYQVDLKATKSLFEGGRAPMPVQRESSSTRAKHQPEIVGELVRPEPAGTKEVVEIHTTKDIKSVKEKFESPTKEEADEDAKPKSPIDIQEEARAVMRKEKEVKEEVQKSNDESEPTAASDSEHTDTEGEVVLEHDSDHEPREATSDVDEERHDSVSSEELVETEEMVESLQETVEEKEEPEEESQDENQQEAAAAVVPVRVAIPEDLNEQKQEPEPQQQYETYEKVIDYNEEVQHPAQSDSDSEKEAQDSAQEIKKDEVIADLDDDGLKQNGYKEDNVDSSYESNEAQNHLDDSVSSEKGISSASSNQDDSQQQLSLSSSSQPDGEEVAADGEVGFLQ